MTCRINTDIGLLFLELLYGIFVLALVTCTSPTAAVVSDEDSVNRISNLSASSFIDDDQIATDSSNEVEKLKALQLKAAKCGITGGYTYRATLIIGVNLLSTTFNILSNRTALSSGLKSGNPILDFLQLVNIFVSEFHLNHRFSSILPAVVVCMHRVS